MASPFIDDDETVVGPKTRITEGQCVLLTYCGNTSPDDDESRSKCYDEVKQHRTNNIAETSKPEEDTINNHARNDSPGQINRAASRGADSGADGAAGGTATGPEESKAAGRGEWHSFASSLRMMVLCVARTCSAELLRPPMGTSSHATKRTDLNDARLSGSR